MEAASYRESHLESGTFYGKAPRPWDRYIYHWQEVHAERIVRRLYPPDPGQASRVRYLDFACGTGRITKVVAPYVSTVTGVDISPTMLARAKEAAPGAHLILGDLTTQDLGLGSYDLITAFRFFGNAERDLRISAIHALAKLQPKGGVLITNNHRNPNALPCLLRSIAKGDAPQTTLTHGMFVDLLTRAGYRIRRVYPVGLWAWRAKAQNKATTRPRFEAVMEKALGWRWLAPVAPDCIVVAERV